jgi:hypothetical protein
MINHRQMRNVLILAFWGTKILTTGLAASRLKKVVDLNHPAIYFAIGL